MNQQQPSPSSPSVQGKEQQQPNLSLLNIVQDMEHRKSSTSQLSINQKQTSSSPLNVDQSSVSLSMAQAWEIPSASSTPLNIAQVQTNDKQQVTVSTSHVIRTPGQQLDCSLSFGSQVQPLNLILLVPLHQVHLAPHQPHHFHQSPPNKTKTCQSVFLSIK